MESYCVPLQIEANKKYEIDFDAETYDIKPKMRQFLTYHGIKYPSNAKKQELSVIFKNQATRLRAEKIVLSPKNLKAIDTNDL